MIGSDLRPILRNNIAIRASDPVYTGDGRSDLVVRCRAAAIIVVVSLLLVVVVDRPPPRPPLEAAALAAKSAAAVVDVGLSVA